MKYVQNAAHHLLSKSSVTTKLCVKLRNQANCVIAYHLGESPDSSQNGEFALLDCVAPHCETFVDVGANVGNWTKYFIQRAQKPSCGYLFEPSVQCAEQLKREFRGQNITIQNIALADSQGEAMFAEIENFGEHSSLLPHEGVGEAKKFHLVPVSTLDDEMGNRVKFIDFLKIDTEGFDLKVMRGAGKLLGGGRIRFLQFEYNAPWLGAGSSLIEAINYLSEFGYKAYLIKSSGIHPINYSIWGDYFRYSNYFACRDEHLSAAASLIRSKI
jgi:FkbM family methyltransferase